MQSGLVIVETAFFISIFIFVKIFLYLNYYPVKVNKIQRREGLRKMLFLGILFFPSSLLKIFLPFIIDDK